MAKNLLRERVERKKFEKKEGFYFIMTNNGIVERKSTYFKTFRR